MLRITVLAVSLVRAHSELGLRNFKWPSRAQDTDFGKKAWFNHLESVGIKSGFQVDAVQGLCPFATEPHRLRLPTCLKQKYAIFVGDSTMREFAWSFSRLASSDGLQPCQQGDLGANRFQDTRNDPAFGCTVDRNGTQLCPSSAQQGPSTQSCCSAKFQSFYVFAGHPDDNAIAVIKDIESRCDCEGVLFVGFGVHQLLGASPAGTSNPVPWSYPFGRRTGWLSFRERISGGKLDMVLVSPTHLDEYVMMLHPPKPDWRAFAQFSTMAIWDDLDEAVAREMDVKFVSLYRVTRAYRGCSAMGCTLDPLLTEWTGTATASPSFGYKRGTEKSRECLNWKRKQKSRWSGLLGARAQPRALCCCRVRSSITTGRQRK